MKNIHRIKKLALSTAAIIVLASCGGGGGIATALSGLDRIKEYAQTGGILPTLQDYHLAGATGVVTDVDLAEINEVVEGLEGKDVDTLEELQIVINDTHTSPTENTSSYTVTHNGFTYGTFTSKRTKRVWLDRNLGATEVCHKKSQSLDPHPNCWGGFFQWGRGDDGHQFGYYTREGKDNLSDKFTMNASSTLDPGHGKFIARVLRGDSMEDPHNMEEELEDWPAGMTSTKNDWLYDQIDFDGKKRAKRWSSIDGSSVCPVGFRVPTIQELEDELSSSSGEIGDFNIARVKPMDGRYIGYMHSAPVGTASLWSVDTKGKVFASSWAYEVDDYKGHGPSGTFRIDGCNIRCIRDAK